MLVVVNAAQKGLQCAHRRGEVVEALDHQQVGGVGEVVLDAHAAGNAVHGCRHRSAKVCGWLP